VSGRSLVCGRFLQFRRDYDVQQHKAEVYAEFERRLKTAFPEGFKVDRFEFGLCREKDDCWIATKLADRG
jgi:hypothetical protein